MSIIKFVREKTENGEMLLMKLGELLNKLPNKEQGWWKAVKLLRKKILSIVLAMIIMVTVMPVAVYADIGPKPSVVINFKGLEKESYYVTLLSETASTGPHSALGEHSGNQRYHEGDEDYQIWEKFLSYQDQDGYYFLQYFGEGGETSQFTWGYYPPSKFKILIYFPAYDQFAVSGEVYERYAFDSYYSADVKDLELGAITPAENIEAVRDYDYTWELLSLLARIIGTIGIEVLIALLFGFRAAQQLLLIGAVNAVTQSLLNILLNVINYNQGSMMFVINYIWMELLVFVIEAGVYSALLPRYSGKESRGRGLVLLYALVANMVSFGLGLYIAYRIPGIF